MFWVLGRLSYWDGSFGHPLCMFWYRNRKNSYWLHILYPAVCADGVGAQGNPLSETVLLSTHKVCFGREIRKISYWLHTPYQSV